MNVTIYTYITKMLFEISLYHFPMHKHKQGSVILPFLQIRSDHIPLILQRIYKKLISIKRSPVILLIGNSSSVVIQSKIGRIQIERILKKKWNTIPPIFSSVPLTPKKSIMTTQINNYQYLRPINFQQLIQSSSVDNTYFINGHILNSDINTHNNYTYLIQGIYTRNCVNVQQSKVISMLQKNILYIRRKYNLNVIFETHPD
eukprot:TRINITY_DN9879_c0_g3_i2.p1 TRINITY_DN9879_c0_g3~~TRINITY_DN9879_c0_g3_i2.p1  ORF type:complete len:202 (-),score=-21.95 TRINITY_DN9879_c0_g3_i2:401-1006(-)